MGRPDASWASQTSDQTPFQPPPQGYPNHHVNPLSAPPPQQDQNTNRTHFIRSYVPPSPEYMPSPPPHEAAYMADNVQNLKHSQFTRMSSYVPPSPEKIPTPPQTPRPQAPQFSSSYVPEYMPPAPPSRGAYMADNDENVNHPQFIPQSPPPRAAYMADDDEKSNHPQFTSSHVPPPSGTYPPQKTATYQPQQTQPAVYPPAAVDDTASYTPRGYNYNAHTQAVGTPGAAVWYHPPGTMVAPGWNTGLLECFDHPDNALMTLCFPCVTFGQIAEIVDDGKTSWVSSALSYILVTAFFFMPCMVTCSYRTKIRMRYGLPESTAPDWVIHLFCQFCALCQEYRELKARGMDPALGWQGNLSRNQQMLNNTTMTPPANQTMMS